MTPKRFESGPSRSEQEPGNHETSPIEKWPEPQITAEQARRYGRLPVAHTTRDGSRQLTPEQARALGRRAIDPDRSEPDRNR